MPHIRSFIEIFIKKLINKGFKPDLVTIDYFECVKSESGGHSTDSQWVKEGITMRKFHAKIYYIFLRKL